MSLLSRNKSARTITYSQFKEALAELARKRCKDKSSEDAAEEVYKLIEGKSPVISGVTVKPTADVLLFLCLNQKALIVSCFSGALEKCLINAN